jgi:hypothetical protein
VSDRRPEQAARHVEQLTDNLTQIARLLIGWSSRIGQMPPPRRPERLVKPPGTSDPTSATYVGGETAYLGMVDRYLDLIVDTNLVCRNLGGDPAVTLAGWAILNDPPPAGTERWRNAIRDVHHQTIRIVDELERAWHAKYELRYQHTQAGLVVLDEMLDIHVTNDIDLIAKLSQRSRTLARQLNPGPARQKPLVYCTNHTDRLARYRGKELCDACYQAERKQPAHHG